MSVGRFTRQASWQHSHQFTRVGAFDLVLMLVVVRITTQRKKGPSITGNQSVSLSLILSRCFDVAVCFEACLLACLCTSVFVLAYVGWRLNYLLAVTAGVSQFFRFL